MCSLISKTFKTRSIRRNGGFGFWILVYSQKTISKGLDRTYSSQVPKPWSTVSCEADGVKQEMQREIIGAYL